MQKEIDAERVQLGQEADEVLQSAAEAVNAPIHHHIELPTAGVAAHRVA